MAVNPDGTSPSSGGWKLLAAHDWSDAKALETSICAAVEELDGVTDEVFLYEYVDVEAVRDALKPESRRGVSEVRFDYGRHEVRVTEDGTIAVR
jgi:hypothetical protein